MNNVHMRQVAIFYHVYLGGGEIPCDHENVVGIISEQLSALHASGLMAGVEHFSIGVSGSEYDAFMVAAMAPEAHVTQNSSGLGEVPTIQMLQAFCKSHPNWYVLYIHTKGAIYKGFQHVVAWRKCMENCVIWRWQSCLADLESGVDSCGCHWLTPMRFPIIGNNPYWAGNFFWARSDFLNTLPPVNTNTRYDAEAWIGTGRRKPRVRDYAPHWPGAACMQCA
jgi:hypothetical protein